MTGPAWRAAVVALMLMAAAGCGRDGGAPRAAAEPRAAAADDRAPDNPAEVRIDEGMLRDLRVTTTAVESRLGGDTVALFGELAVDEERYAELGVPVTARATRLLAGIGDRVQAGQPLLELESADVGRARSVYWSTAARLALTERAVARTRELAAERIAPARELQEAEASLAAARADLLAATAALRALGLDAPQEDASAASGSPAFALRTPVGGIVIDRRARRGQMLDPGVAAVTVADLSTLWLTVHAFERDAVRIVPGATAEVVFSALPGRVVGGRVLLVGRQVSSESRTIDVRIEVANPDGLLRPGMAASAAVPVGSAADRILTVPVGAVQRVGESWCVFVPRSPTRFEVRRIGRGRDVGMEVEVLSGLQAGEVIVVDGAFLLRAEAERRDADHEEH